MMLRIGEAANKFNISKRALRYWEDEGLIRSIRHENEYRYYDEENIERINTIVLYRRFLKRGEWIRLFRWGSGKFIVS